MKKFIAAVFLFTATLLSSSAFAEKSVNIDAKGVSLLFVQVADAGTLKPIEGKSGYYQLDLKGVKDYIGYFSDRPQRISGLYPTSKFILRWHDGTKPGSFNQEPPNVVLNAITDGVFSKKMIHLPLQMSNPVYDAKTATLSYTVQLLPGTVTHVSSEQMHDITLFIDNGYCASCVA